MKSSPLVMFIFVLLFSSCNDGETETLTIAAASNMQFAMEELAEVFTKKTGIECETILGSSGKLTAQIMEGAPFDIFVSADTLYPQELFKKGLTKSAPGVYASGKLVLWTMKQGVIPSVEVLRSADIKHIAIANPKTAPYGVAAVEVLKNYGVYGSVKDKLVFGENISQTNQFIISNAAQIGFTGMSVVRSEVMKDKGKWVEIEQSAFTPIKQGVVILKNRNSRKKEAQKFYSFLFSKEGKEILDNFGYAVKK